MTSAAVIMFDVRVPDSDQNFGMGIKLAKFWRNIQRGGAGYLSKKIGEKSEYYWSRFMERAVLPAGVNACKMLGRPLSPALRFHWISQGHWYALSRYTFKPFPGKITLVRATDQGPEVLGRSEDLTLGWGRLAQGGVEVIDVPTKHMLMLFEPYVETFAATLKTISRRSISLRHNLRWSRTRSEGNRSRTSFSASSAVAIVPSNCASSAARSISRNPAPGLYPAAISSRPVINGCGRTTSSGID